MSKANQRYVSWARKRWVAAVKRHIGPKKIRQIAIEKALDHLEKSGSTTSPIQLEMYTKHYEREINRLQ